MFKNVGKTIKTISIIFCCLGIVGSLVGGIPGLAHADTNVASWGIIIGGIVLSILLSLFMFAFGELIVRVVSIDC